MDELLQENNIIAKQINLLSDSVSLNQKIDDIKDHPLLLRIIEEMQGADQLIEATNNLLEYQLQLVRDEYDTVMRSMRETQAEILKYLVKLKKQKLAREEQVLELKTPSEKIALLLSDYGKSQLKTPGPMQGKVVHSALKQVKLKFSDLALTPKMTIKDYKESPLVSKIKLNVPIEFVDFDIHITPQQFDSIPKYMRGRTSHDELQKFLDCTIIPCFVEKYKLLHRKRAAVKQSKDFELWKIFQSQISYVPGRNFITAGDISRKMEKMIDKKMQSLLVMLRHIGILQEQRVSQTTCYIWAATA